MKTLLIAMSSLAAFCAAAAELKTPVNSGTTFARDALSPYIESGELPGAISVFYKDGAQETCCIGYADVARKIPIALDQSFMQCSQTKGFCGVTIAILVEEGKLNLDDPVSKYIPEFGELWYYETVTNDMRVLRKVKNTPTVRNVMNHTSGLAFEVPNYTKIGGWSRRMPLRSVAAMAAGVPLQFEPGTKVQYSNIGIDVGAAIVEVVTGKRWEDFLQERVLNPLGMSSTTFKPTAGQLANRIMMYTVKAGQKAAPYAEAPSMQAPFNDDRVFASAGAGLWTTVNDQLKFYKMLMNLGLGDNGVRILKEETVKNLLAVSSRPKGMGGYSLGLNAPETDSDEAFFGHGGAWDTRCSVNWHRRELQLWAVQLVDSQKPWNAAWGQASQKFFKAQLKTGVEAYTGRMK